MPPKQAMAGQLQPHLQGPSRSTRWRHARGQPTRQDKAASQQYLSPCEEQALLEYVLRMADRGYPLAVKFLRTLAFIIARQRTSVFPVASGESDLQPPGKNWPQSFYKRHPELQAKRLRPLDWTRHDVNIYDKVAEWFTVIGKELERADVLTENVYNMDETGTQLSVLSSLKVLVRQNDPRSHRGTGVKRTMITAIECISADGRCLDPLIIWPATTHRSTWTAHAQPGWHFACSKTGYTDTAISLYWMQHVFDPLTRERARGRPRVLINDGFGTHESLELLQFCFEHHIILCRLPSHTSHKLQPCDVGVFGPLKTAYREQVEQLYRGGAQTITKAHFPLLYSRARRAALTVRNIKSGWSKTGLFPLHPERVLHELKRSPVANHVIVQTAERPLESLAQHEPSLRTPITSRCLNELCAQIEQHVTHDHPSKTRLQKLVHAAEKAFADRSLLLDENRLLFEQNNEKVTRASLRSTITGTAKVMTYDDIVAAEQRRQAQAHGGTKSKKKTVRTAGLSHESAETQRADEQRKGEDEIQRLGLQEWCHIFSAS